MGWFLGIKMLLTGTFSSPASAMSVPEVRDLPHEVRLGLTIIFMFNMYVSTKTKLLQKSNQSLTGRFKSFPSEANKNTVLCGFYVA